MPYCGEFLEGYLVYMKHNLDYVDRYEGKDRREYLNSYIGNLEEFLSDIRAFLEKAQGYYEDFDAAIAEDNIDYSATFLFNEMLEEAKF